MFLEGNLGQKVVQVKKMKEIFSVQYARTQNNFKDLFDDNFQYKSNKQLMDYIKKIKFEKAFVNEQQQNIIQMVYKFRESDLKTQTQYLRKSTNVIDK